MGDQIDAGQIALLAPIIAAATEVVKQTKPPTRLVPLIPLLLGVGIALLLDGPSWGDGLNGIVAGLASMGLWSGGKAVAGKS